MDTILKTRAEDKFVTVDGLKIRYIEAGSGPAVLFTHGASIGSSADVFQRNLPPFAAAGFRAIAFDFAGYGRSEVGDDLSLNLQREQLPKFMDALGIKTAALVAHSRSGGFAVQLALKDPARYTHVAILGTGTMLPPLQGDVEGRYAGYCGQVTTMAMLGRVSPVYRDMWKLQQEALAACHAALRPGITLGDLARRTEAVAAGTPYKIKFLMHGRGLGDDTPMYVFSAPTEIQRWAIVENSSFITKPVVTRDGHADVMWGDSIVVTAKGPQRLGTLAPDFTELV